MRRSWPSLVAAVVDLIDGQRWNLSDQVQSALLRRPSVERGIFEFYGRKADPDFAAQMDIADQIEREWRGLVGSRKVQITGINAATGAAVSLPGAVAAVSDFRFDSNQVVLPGTNGLRLLVGEVREGAPVAGGKKATRLNEVRDFIAEKYPIGIPAGVTDKAIARATGASERTVRRARQHD
jgi:hypothetical protein